jgi:hypothetical protein
MINHQRISRGPLAESPIQLLREGGAGVAEEELSLYISHHPPSNHLKPLQERPRRERGKEDIQYHHS